MKQKRILFYGLGNGRDHANHIFSISSEKNEVFSIIQNPNALMEKCKNVIRENNFDKVLEIAKEINPDLVVISNRVDLSNDIAEKFKKNGFKVFGISSKASKLETCKEFAKKFMKKYNIKTPDYFVTDNKKVAIEYINKNWKKKQFGLVFKVDQGSKNSFDRTAVPDSLSDAIKEINRLFDSNPNSRIIIEEKIKGYEISLHVLIKDNEYSILPIVQDYKKKYPNNEGPMTAGTASVSENIEIPQNLLMKIKNNIIEPSINGFHKENIEYNYILYIGLMITDIGEPYVLEYNTRTGNPEWIALLGLLNVPLSELFEKYYDDFSKIETFWKKNMYSMVVYGFSAGYPETERSLYSEEITFNKKMKKNTLLIGEHIEKRKNSFFPTGGRVFAVHRTGPNFEILKKEIFNEFKKVRMNGLYYREDIEKINI